jgi:hypothetical protein
LKASLHNWQVKSGFNFIMSYFIDLTGQRFGKLVVLQRAEKPKGIKGKEAYWLCQCDCGNQKVVVSYSLKSLNTQSCGCYHRERTTKHGKNNDYLYHIWRNIKAKCYNKKNPNYNLYGGRGITVCDDWKNDFMSFYNWANVNGYKNEKLPSGRNKLTIDRIDVNGNYEPSNCRWVTQKIQCNNTRRTIFIEINNEKKPMQQLIDEYNINRGTFYNRYIKGLRGEDLIAPLKRHRERNKK